MVLREIGRRPVPQEMRSIPSKETVQDNEKRSLSARLVELRSELMTQKGSVGLGLLEELAAGRISVQEFSHELDEAPDFEQFQELGLQFLEDNGFVEHTKEGGVVVDITALKEVKQPSELFFNPYIVAGVAHARYKAKQNGYHIDGLQEIFKKSYNFETWCSTESNSDRQVNFITFLTNVFMGKEVVSREEWESWESSGSKPQEKPKAKPLVYTPESAEAAFDPEQIRAAEFHIGSWSLPGRKPTEFSSVLPDLSFDEASLAALIYHPQYGDGKRDEKGILTVVGNDGRRKKMSQAWLRENLFTTYRINEGEKALVNLIQKSPRVYLNEDNLPNLQENNLLKQSDFTVLQEGDFSQKYGPGREIRDRVGMVLLNDKIRYTLGAGFSDGKNRVVYLEPGKLAGIVLTNAEGDETLTHTFSLFSRDELIQKGKKPDPKNGVITIGKKELTISPYVETEQRIFTDKKNQESEEQYETRARAFSAAELLHVRNEIITETGVNFGKLNVREQGSFTTYYTHASKEDQKKIHDFIKKYRGEGLQILSSLEPESEIARMIFELDSRLGVAEASLVLRQYGNLVKEAHKVDEEIGNFFKDSVGKDELEKTKVTEEILRRAEKLLVEFGEKQEVDLKEIIERVTNEISVFLSIFKTAYQYKKEFKFEDVQGLDFESKQESPNEEEIRQMEVIIGKNYGKTPLLQGVLKGLHTALSNPRNTFYILKHRGKVVSFDRFEKKVDRENNATGEVEFASFNTDPAYQNSAIGTAMMEQTLELNAREYDVLGDTDPHSPACINYVEKQGFDIVGYEPYKDTGITVFKIKRKKGNARKKDTHGTVISFGNEKEVVENVKKHLDQGKKIVRYYKDKKTSEFFGVVE